ncbi:MAG: hypothetical protein KDA61_03800, partial [Planctomycetales bacterium]|nr:hypothetical protein [Planctomycetales bacterium]
IPRKLASYRTFNFNIGNGFQYFDTLFDAIAGYPDAFQGVIEGLQMDPFGPQVNVEEEFIKHLGRRVTLVTDYEVPITTKSERFLFVVEVSDAQAVSAAIAKFMEVDQHAYKLDVDGVTVWEIREPADEFPELEFGGELDPLAPAPHAAPAEGGHGGAGNLVRNSAVCVFDNHLLIASHLGFLKSALANSPSNETLAAAGDYHEVEAAMSQLLDGPAAVRCFVRTDEAYRPTYELLRQGKMPESETLLGRFLNRLLTAPEDEDEGVLRKQKIDGRQLPSFEMVRRYFSPAGAIVRSDEDGWFVVGATLSKRDPQARAGRLIDEQTRR